MKHLRQICLMFLTTLLCALYAAAAGETTMTVMSIGKADCILLQTEQYCWMVDTGTEEAWDQVRTYLECADISEIDGVILTHADKDHIGGTGGLLESDIRVKNWYTSAFCAKYIRDTNPAVNAVLDGGGEIVYLRQGDVLRLTDTDRISVLWPDRYSEDENENSLVLFLETRDGSILLMGDVLAENEKEMVSEGLIPKCDILKVGHHGREDATGKKLLSACSPKVAVITAEMGEKKSKVDPDVLKRLMKRDVQVILTHYAQQAVKLTLDAGNVKVNLIGESCEQQT